jgi:hypothetical protein
MFWWWGKSMVEVIIFTTPKCLPHVITRSREYLMMQNKVCPYPMVDFTHRIRSRPSKINITTVQVEVVRGAILSNRVTTSAPLTVEVGKFPSPLHPTHQKNQTWIGRIMMLFRCCYARNGWREIVGVQHQLENDDLLSDNQNWGHITNFFGALLAVSACLAKFCKKLLKPTYAQDLDRKKLLESLLVITL